MEKKIETHRGPLLGYAITLLLVIGCCHVSSILADEKKVYIVHMDKSHMPTSFENHIDWYDSSLKEVSDKAEILYAYTHVTGFSVRLTQNEADEMMNRPGVLTILSDMKYELHTTRTPWFLGLDQKSTLLPTNEKVSDVVIGIVDTGVWPESPSFDDTGLGHIPDSWKGECENGKNFSKFICNKKLVGARSFREGYIANYGPINESRESITPRDIDGHGTHTSTTAAGSIVDGANLLGYANGTARGMAPSARVAVYKVCWSDHCWSSDILSAMDKAIADNVNVLSLSLGGSFLDYFKDSIAIGAFAAMKKGIFVSCSAGNGGPSYYTVSNVAPWITTVGAGTLDRDFPAYVILGNGKNYSGVSLYNFLDSPLPDKQFPFVYAGDVRNDVSNITDGTLCMQGTLNSTKVNGKIVLCERGNNSDVEKGYVVKLAGGVGMVLVNTADDGEGLVADAHLLPATAVGQTAGNEIKDYLFSDPNPNVPFTCTILSGGTKVGIEPSPLVAAFSSRGPNSITPGILKPDLIAPGVNILAGWSGAASPSDIPEDNRRVSFNIISGTSMSCPHVSGLAALLKAAHPDWSPAAIRSALMTTAYTTYKNGEVIQDVSTGKASIPFDIGSGHVNPVSALDPGLVYDLVPEDYFNFLCASNYTSEHIRILGNFTCDAKESYSVNDLNYPSFAVSIQSQKSSDTVVVNHKRTLTNVGQPGTYKVSTSTSGSVSISVVPDTLTFSQTNEKKSYTATFTATTVCQRMRVRDLEELCGLTLMGNMSWGAQLRLFGSKSIIDSRFIYRHLNTHFNISK
ncbi:hypothetical protein OROGR_028621 [Orobanche gracilis]